jgi:hypothetical protein
MTRFNTTQWHDSPYIGAAHGVSGAYGLAHGYVVEFVLPVMPRDSSSRRQCDLSGGLPAAAFLAIMSFGRLLWPLTLLLNRNTHAQE